MADNSKLNIAIIGAGITGLTAAIALKNHSGIDIQIYERAAELREIGASIALGPNGMRTLDTLGVHNALDDSVAFRNKSRLPMIYRRVLIHLGHLAKLTESSASSPAITKPTRSSQSMPTTTTSTTAI